MIIECIKCSKKFEVNSELIPDSGRTIQCGSCNHTWFFKKSHQSQIKISEKKTSSKVAHPGKKDEIPNKKIDTKKISKRKSSEIIKYQPKSKFTFGKFLSYILVIIISFIGFIIILDTFKSPLFEIFPNLESILYNLYETLTDIKLFIKDLI